MPSTFTTNLGLEKPATGEQAGTWGNTANNSYDFLDAAIDGDLTVAITGNYNLATTAGAASQGRNKVITWTGALTANATITIQPNTAQKIYYMINATTGGFSLVFSQGSGPTFTLNAGQSAIIYCDGGGLGAGVRGANYNPQLGSVVVQTLTVSGGSLSVTTMTVTGTLTAGAASLTTLAVSGAATVGTTLTATGVLTGSELVLTRSDTTGPAITSNGGASPLRVVVAGAEALRILPAGNVAIGTASPDASNRLQVQGNLAVPTGAGLFTTVTRTSGMWDNGGALTFRTNGADNRMVITAAGLVGINTAPASVAYQLDVAGWIRSTAGGIVFPDGTTQSSAASPAFTNRRDVTSQRAIATNYQNTTGKPLLVMASVKNGVAGIAVFQGITDAGNPPATIVVEGVVPAQNSSVEISFVVLPNHWYRVVCPSGGTPFVQIWSEWF